MKLLVASVLFFVGSAFAADFEGQTEFTHYELEGQFRVTCMDSEGVEYKTHFCRGYILEPKSFAYFTHQTSADVDELNLYNRLPDGTSLYEKSGWDQQAQQSTKAINLWVETLLQTPFLHLGQNKVAWDLRKNNKIQERGVFDVHVHDGGERVCPSLSTTTSNISHCRNSLQACRAYFSQLNNCEGS